MFSVYKSNHIETLVDALAKVVIRDPLPSPFRREWIGIQTQGIGTWMGLELSRRLGILANTFLPFPRALVEEVFKRVLNDRVPDTAAFQRERLTWSILALLPTLLHREEFGTLDFYLRKDDTGLKRFQLAQRIAHLFDQYAVYRYDVVATWERNRDTSLNLPKDLRWQPLLWNALVAEHGPAHLASAADHFSKALQRGNFDPQKLPCRISLFGISTLPPLYMRILGALAHIVPVHLFCLSPTREYWADLRSLKEIGRLHIDPETVEEREALYYDRGHPLLTSMGRVGRDFQTILEETVDYVEPAGDLHVDPAPRSKAPLLARIQSDILNLVRRDNGTEAALAGVPDDGSIAIHSCHSPMREVQVLRDQLLEIFESDPDIDPHDVIVMAPQIDDYAPYIESVFAATQKNEAIPYSISDRSARLEAVVVEAFLAVLSLAQSRVTLQEVLDLLSLDPVHERFGLTPDETLQAQQWLRESGIRWGMDKTQRRAQGQPAFNENTWRFGLERLLLGYALPDEGKLLFNGASPYDKIEGNETETLGRTIEFCQQLFDGLRQLEQERPLSEWGPLLRKLLATLVAENAENTFQHQSVRTILQTLEEDAAAGGFHEPVSLAVIRHLLDQRLARTPSERGFLSGGVTFCNFLPMRSIPFKVVCLLGMNDGVFPRSQPKTGFDLMQRNPRRGDRSMRNDDRYLFLEALLSARARLVITYTGQSIKDNGIRPPSVVVSELIETIGEGSYSNGDQPGTKRQEPVHDPHQSLVVKHPLQPFSPRYFDGASLSLFSYSEAFLDGARALCKGKSEPGPFLAGPISLENEEVETVGLSDLIRFFQNPAAYILRHRLGILFDDDVAEPESREPMTLEGLDRHHLGEQLLGESVGGASAQRIYPLFRASGRLPLGTLGQCTYHDLLGEVAPLAEAVKNHSAGPALRPLSVDIRVAGTRITGKVDRLHGQGRLCYTFGRLYPTREIDLWITHLALNCIAPDPALMPSKLIARGPRGPEIADFRPLAENARPILADLITLYKQGLTGPLLFFPHTSAAYARKWFEVDEYRMEQAMHAALKKWRPSEWSPSPAELDDAHVRRIYGSRDPLADENQASRKMFAELALRIFGPLIEAEDKER